jgi:DNA mismatch endonuclease, patch repair protein
MVDRLSSARRSWNMGRIASKNTGPELAVRRYIHKAGLRYRLHAKELSGKPDLIFRRAKICVFVHGCFWHGCRRCVDGRRRVKSNSSFWRAKVAVNRERDKRHVVALRASGWTVFTIWECEVRSENRLALLTKRIRQALKTAATMPWLGRGTTVGS